MNRPSPMARLGSALQVTEGQAYTLVIGLVLALVSAVVAIPPTLREKASSGAPTALTSTPVEDPAASPVVGDGSKPVDTDRPASRPATVTGRSASGDDVGLEGPHREASPAEPGWSPPDTITPLAAVPEPGAPTGIVVAAGSLWVGTDNLGDRGTSITPRLFELGLDGDVVDEHLVQTGDGDHALQGMAAADGDVFVLQASPAAVLRLDANSGDLERRATIPDLPPCAVAALSEQGGQAECEPSPVDRPPFPRGAAFDPAGNLFVTDANQGTIWKVPAGSDRAEVFHQAVEYVSDQGPAGLAVDGAGNLVMAVTRSVVDGPGGAVYLLEVADSGGPGELVLLATTEAEAAPVGLTLGESGRIYLALSGAHDVAVLEPDGSEAARLLTDSEHECATPMGVSFLATGIVVTCQAPGEPSRAQVLFAPVGEAGLRT